MTIEKLVKYCLQYLEQDSETNVMETDIEELESDDTYKEYLYNIHHSIYMGLVRFATSKILPLKEFCLTSEQTNDDGEKTLKTEAIARLIDNNGKRLFHEVKEIYAIDKNGNMLKGVAYVLIGDKVVLKNIKEDYYYYVLYYPTIHDLSYYNEDIMQIDLEKLGVPDEMAINIKYLVYSDMKIDESASIANLNKNYFENYLSEMQTTKVENSQIELAEQEWGDLYGD